MVRARHQQSPVFPHKCESAISVNVSSPPIVQDMLLKDMERYDAAYGSSTHRPSPFEEGTDTRFETESDMMELCDLAEIL